jgi:hypothetical protein
VRRDATSRLGRFDGRREQRFEQRARIHPCAPVRRLENVLASARATPFASTSAAAT